MANYGQVPSQKLIPIKLRYGLNRSQSHNRSLSYHHFQVELQGDRNYYSYIYIMTMNALVEIIQGI